MRKFDYFKELNFQRDTLQNIQLDISYLKNISKMLC